MFYGYGVLHETEIWNNQRTLDYLFGDPANGVAGLASPYSSVNRKSSCSNALGLYCDQPVELVDMEISGWIYRVDDSTIASVFQSISVDGVERSTMYLATGVAYIYGYTLADVGQPRPDLPDADDPGWVPIVVGEGEIVLPYVSEVTASSPPYFVKTLVSTSGVTGSVEVVEYIDAGGPDDRSAITTNGGVTWRKDFLGVDGDVIVQQVTNEGASRYSTPAQDDAPWFDPLVPDSNDFAGLFVEEVVGFDAMTRRAVDDSALTGGTLGPLNFSTRSITVTGWLYGSTCCGVEYGLSWLTEALVGSNVCDSCSVGDLFMLKCCPPDLDCSLVTPSFTDDPVLFGASIPAGSQFRSLASGVGEWTSPAGTVIGYALSEASAVWDTEECARTNGTLDPLDYVRLMHRVGLTDGPKIVDRQGTCCPDCAGTSLKVQFTITSELPYIFSDAYWVLYQQPFTEGPYYYDLSAACQPCPQPATIEPPCPPSLPPPPAPSIVQSDCYCEPWQTMRIGAEFSNQFQWNNATSYIEVAAGDTDIRNVKIVAFKNPRGIECPLEYESDEFWRCVEPCASIGISWIPSGGRLVIDSRTKTIELIRAGGVTESGLRYVSAGDPDVVFDWFDLGPCTNLCVVASVDGLVADSASISMALVNRYLASGG